MAEAEPTGRDGPTGRRSTGRNRTGRNRATGGNEAAGRNGRRKVARTAGLAGAVLGLAAAGVAAGVAIERYVVGRGRDIPDPYAHEPFGELPADEVLTVPVDGHRREETAEQDGSGLVDLHVEVVDPYRDAELTVVFVHGFCLDMGTFHFQRRELAELTDPRVRMVFYDQPGHGGSGRIPAGDYSLEALGEILRQVIEVVAPDGPLVLVGHSMGGMAIMALAEHHPELFAGADSVDARPGTRPAGAGRVVGVAFVNSSAGNLDEVTFGLPDLIARIRRPLMPVLTGVNRLTPTVVERARRVSSDLAWLLTRRYGFGGESPSPALISYVEEMNSQTSVEVITGYLHTLFEHLRHDTLAALRGIETLVVCGEKDLITPKEHSEEIVKLLPGAELVVVPDGGHVTLMEFHEQVDEHLVGLLRRASGAATTAAAAAPRPRTRRRRLPRLFGRRGQHRPETRA